MCLFVYLVSAIGLYVYIYMYFLEFCTCIHVSFVSTQCGFFPLCVANFSFVASLLLMLYSAVCVLCILYYI